MQPPHLFEWEECVSSARQRSQRALVQKKLKKTCRVICQNKVNLNSTFASADGNKMHYHARTAEQICVCVKLFPIKCKFKAAFVSFSLPFSAGLWHSHYMSYLCRKLFFHLYTENIYCSEIPSICMSVVLCNVKGRFYEKKKGAMWNWFVFFFCLQIFNTQDIHSVASLLGTPIQFNAIQYNRSASNKHTDLYVYHWGRS